VETNLDDSTGEELGHVIGQLLECGALDAWAMPLVMKKGRPGWTLCALGPAPLADLLADVILRETTAIGVRFSSHWRSELPRRTVEVQTPYGVVPVKVSGGSRGPHRHAKPEFEVCRRLAQEHGVAVRRVIEAAVIATDEIS
jgi:hypothetical protein